MRVITIVATCIILLYHFNVYNSHIATELYQSYIYS